MKKISIISNTSIQYYKFETEIDLENFKKNKIYYHEPFDSNLKNFIFDPLIKVINDGYEFYYSKNDLIEKNYLINDKLKEDIDVSNFKCIHDPFCTSNLKRVLKSFNKKWIPLPYFKENSINKNVLFPTDWVRIYINCNEDYSKASIVIGIDTTTAKNEYDIASPRLNENPEENIFKLNNNDLNIRNYVYDNKNNWLKEYIYDVYYGNNTNLKLVKPYQQYVANYILFINWLNSLTDLPEIQLFSDQSKKIEVDLVVDLGNSATCALLFENNDTTNFNFNKVKKLNIQNYSNPLLNYDNPFPMNVIFCESIFGVKKNDSYHNNKFIVPSFVRIGFEAL